MMETVIAKHLASSEGPRQDNFPSSLWNYNGNQAGCAIPCSDFTPEDALGTFFNLPLRNDKINEYYSDSYANFNYKNSYTGTVNFNRLAAKNPHLHFKGYHLQKFFYENFRPYQTILLIRKIDDKNFDTYFINDNHYSYAKILSLIKGIRPNGKGAVFIEFDFNSFNAEGLPPELPPERFRKKLKKSKTGKRVFTQGRNQDPKRRKAVEEYAEEYIKNYLKNRNISFVEKHGKPYDLLFQDEIRVEVKGSQLENISQVYVTENELLHANDQLKSPLHAKWKPNTKVYLAVVENIKVDQNYKASGGRLVHLDIFQSPDIQKWRKENDLYFDKKSQLPILNIEKAKFKYKLSRKVTIK